MVVYKSEQLSVNVKLKPDCHWNCKGCWLQYSTYQLKLIKTPDQSNYCTWKILRQASYDHWIMISIGFYTVFWFDDTLVARSESFKPVARSIAIYATRRAVFDSVSQLLSIGVGFTTVWDWLSSLRRGSNALLHLSQTQFNQWLKRSWIFNPIKFNWYYWEWLRHFSRLTSRE